MKHKFSKFCSTILLSSALLSNTNSFGSQGNFSNVYSFGDSFTAAQNSWAALISQRYGAAFVDNKTNFAIGGAQTLDLVTELANYKANVQGFNSNALYLVYMGPSDIDGLVLAFGTDWATIPGGLTISQIASGLQNGTLNSNNFPHLNADADSRATAMATFIKDISDSGAKYIVVLNHFNEAYRPDPTPGQPGIPGANNAERIYFGDLLSDTYNSAMLAQLNAMAPNSNVIYADYARLIDELVNNPNRFFSPSEIAGTYNNQGVFDTTAHPTSSAQKITAQYITSIIESPSRVAYLREVPIATGMNIIQNIRVTSYNLLMRPKGLKFSTEVSGNYSSNHTKSITRKAIGLKSARTGDLQARFNFHVDDNLVFAIQVNGERSKIKFKDNYGKADINEVLITLNSVYRPVDTQILCFLGAGMGPIQYDIKRYIPLGNYVRTERGKPSGVHYVGTIGAGYNYRMQQNFVLTPFASLNYQDVSLKSYRERGVVSSTTMNFKVPNRKSLIGEIGATIENTINVWETLSVTPTLTITYGHELTNSKKTVTSSVSDMSRIFSVPTYKVDRSYVTTIAELRALRYDSINFGIKGGLRSSKNTKFWSVGVFAGLSF